ncbi:MAG: hypothetical protein IJ410_09020 [Oscillospiraceae bacterium]|nr:hypothetical protein [Oscillospiraceae bacterium]
MLNNLFAFAVILMFAFGLHALFDIRPQLTPVISLTVLVDIIILFAMKDLLMPGVIFAYLLAFALFGIAVYKNKDILAKKLDEFLTPGIILFVLASLAMWALLAVRQPMMTEWDEFSFWGISQKLVHYHDQLYTFFRSSMIGNSTPPALAVLSYFFQWMNPEFAEWMSFFAYDVMFFAVYCSFTALFERKSWNSAVMTFLLGFLSPYIYEVYTKIIYLEPAYMITYADLPLGIMFGGIVAVYFFSQHDDSRSILCIIPMIMMLTFIKDMGFALSCIAAFIVFVDLLFGRKEFSFLKVKGFFGKILAGIAMVATAAGSFFGWSFFMARVMERDPFALGGAANMGMVEMLVVGVKELLIGPRSQKFSDIYGFMIKALYTTRMSFLGTAVQIIGLITIIFLIAIIFGDKKSRLRSVMMYIASFGCFVAYYVFHIFLYVYIFKHNEAYALASYNRYIYPYYLGWTCFAIVNLCHTIQFGKRRWAKTALFVLTGAIFVMFTYLTDYPNLFVEASERNYAVRESVEQKVEYMEDTVEDDDVIYLYSGGDNGQRWFLYTYLMAENYIVEDLGAPVDGLSEEEARQVYRETLFNRFKQTGVTHVFIDCSSEFFINTFGDVFDVPMDFVGMDSAAYYKVIYEEDMFRCELVKGGYVNG